MEGSPTKRTKLKSNSLIKNQIVTKIVATFDVPELKTTHENSYTLPDNTCLRFYPFQTYSESIDFFNTITTINMTQNLGFNPPAIYTIIDKDGTLMNERMKFKSLKFLLELLIDKAIALTGNEQDPVLNLLSNEMIVEYLTEIFKKIETVPRVNNEIKISSDKFLSILEEKRDVLLLIKRLDNDYKMIIPNADTLESIKEFLINYRAINEFTELDSKLDSLILNDFTRDELLVLETEYKYFVEYLGRFDLKVTEEVKEKKIEKNTIPNPLLEAVDEFIIENYDKIKDILIKTK
ncbi:hypothetical protein CDIK_0307 [Cucumispora dikerogammari]|nr:hypothetical protein CDIK_0307 [Cucumispora dikerogammari]